MKNDLNFPLVKTDGNASSESYKYGFTYEGNRYEVPKKIGKWEVAYTFMGNRNSFYGFNSLAYELNVNWGDSCSTHVLMRMDLHSLVEQGGLGTWFLDVFYYIETPQDVAFPVGREVCERGSIRKIDDWCMLMDRAEKIFNQREAHPLLNGNKSVARFIA